MNSHKRPLTKVSGLLFHPALPEEQNRYNELTELIDRLLKENSANQKIFRAEFLLPENPRLNSVWYVPKLKDRKDYASNNQTPKHFYRSYEN
jgi:hypothetical protein